MAEVSSTRLYLGNLPRDVTKEDIQTHFKDAAGTIAEVKLMNGFGFIEYEDAMDARDVVPNGSDLNGSRLTVQFARGARQRNGNEFAGPPERPHPRPRRTAHRMQITGLPGETSWQDLKDFARRSGLDVVYSEVGRDRDGKGFVEFETAADLKVAVDKLDNNEFKGATVGCTADHSLKMRSHVTTPATVVLAPHHLDVVLILQRTDTTIVALLLVTMHHVTVMSIVVVARRPVTMKTTAVTIVATGPRHRFAPAVVHLSMNPTHLLAEATNAIRMPPHHLDVPTMTPTAPTGMGDQERGARLRGDMEDTIMTGNVTGDCSSSPFLFHLKFSAKVAIEDVWRYSAKG
ncbi:MAG: hypothetical protein Q9186_003165 [Xanthomendoza sp. 1 TL-2023]